MSLIVQKFGGSSVADANKLRNVARIITDTYQRGNDVVVVLSAQGDTTDDLIEKAKELNPHASKREMDMLLSKDKNVARIALVGLADQPGIAFKIFSLLAKENINVDIILQSIGRDGSKDISFTVARGDSQRAREVMEENKEVIGCKSVELNDQIAKISVVGAGMANNAGVACKMFEALFSAGININMISTSEIKVSVLVDERDAERAVQAVHDRFFSEFGSNG